MVLAYLGTSGLLVPTEQVLAGEGRPASGLGVDGNTYFREDTGWTYTKSGGTWSLSNVPRTQANPFANVFYYIDEYISLQYQMGDIQTNGSAYTNSTLQDYYAGTFLALGADGVTENFKVVNDPVDGAPKQALRMIGQYNDDATGGSNGRPRTMIRSKDVEEIPGKTDADVEFSTGVPYLATLSINFGADLLDAFGATSGATGNVMWQMHASPSIGSPPMALRLYPTGGSPTLGESVPYVAPTLTMNVLTAVTNDNWVANAVSTIRLNKTLISGPTAGVWYDFVLYFQMNYSGATKLKVWVAQRGSGYTLKVDSTVQFGYEGLSANYYATFGHYFQRSQYPNFIAGEMVTAHFKNVCYSDSGATEPTSDELTDLFAYLALR